MRQSEEIIKIENLSKSFGTTEIIKNISFSVYRGEVLGIIGPSGSGKSTILRCITQLETVSGGSVSICGQNLVKDGIYADKTALRSIALKTGLVFQNFNLFPHYSVLQNVADAPRRVLGKTAEEANALAVDLLSRMGLADKIENYPFTGSRISWSKLKIHISKSFHELPKFINEVSNILSSLNENQSNIILIGNDFQDGYCIDFSIKNLELISHFLMEYPGENYLFGLNQEWCICIYDVLDFGLPEPKLS